MSAAPAVEPLDHTAPVGDGEMTIYVAYSPEGELLYIGKTRNLSNRLRGHRYSPWWEFAGVIRTVVGLTWDEAHDTEKTLIRQLAPVFNIAHQAQVPQIDLNEFIATRSLAYQERSLAESIARHRQTA